MNSLTVYVKIKPGHVDSLREILEDINAHQHDNKYLQLKNGKLTHCSRWVIVEDEVGPGADFCSPLNSTAT